MSPSTSLKVCILDLNYVMEGGIPVIRMWGKTDSGKSVAILDKTFRPYFYIEPHEDTAKLRKEMAELELDGQRIESIEEVEKMVFSVPKKFLRLEFTQPSSVARFRETLKEWKGIKDMHEYGISFYRRYMIDRGIIPANWYRVWGNPVKDPGIRADHVIEATSIKPVNDISYPKLKCLAFDIEVVDEDEEERIIMISVHDSAGFRKAFTHERGRSSRNLEVLANEKKMIESFMSTVQKRDPDVILGYNTDRYDFVRLRSRADTLKIPLVLGREDSEMNFTRRGWISAASVKGRVHLDLFDFIERVMKESLSTEVLTLDRVSLELLGMKKDSMSWEDIQKSWQDGDTAKIARYCLRDSELTLKLGNSILHQILEISRVVGQTPFDVTRMTYSQLVEWLLIMKAFEAGEMIPKLPEYDEIQRRRKVPPYTGGYVHEPSEGIHDNIALFDFQSLYPSITITHNISPDTLNCACCIDNKAARVPGETYHFCRKKKGFIPRVLEEIVNRRMAIKRKMSRAEPGTLKYRTLYNRQNTLKILANSIYGYYAYAGSRWYSRVCAQSIASWGRHYIMQVIRKAERMKLSVIYGDTDSLFLRVRYKKDAYEFLERANRSLPGMMELDLQGIYASGIFVLAKSGTAAKKRYALLEPDGNIIIRGFEKVRRDWAAIARDTQEKVLMAVLKDRSPEKAVRIVRGIIKRLEEQSVSRDDVVIHTQITRRLDEYEQVGPHVVAARKAAARGKSVPVGSTISYIITAGEGTISQRAMPAEYAGEYDPEYYIHNQVIPAALRVLSGLGYTKDDLLRDSGGQSSLKGFLGGR